MKDATEGMKNMTKICRMYLGLKKCDKSISYENYNMGKNNVIMIKKNNNNNNNYDEKI